MALNLLEQAEFMLPDGVKTIDGAVLKSVMGDAFKRYDKKGDRHYDTVSAFIKSMRGSDADAALHYLAEMLESGEDVRFIARRIVICAAEDVGNADPMALVVANSAAQAAHFIGLPEAQLPLAQAVCYIANAPKAMPAARQFSVRVKKRVRCRARCPNICATRITPVQVRWDTERAINIRTITPAAGYSSSICLMNLSGTNITFRRILARKKRCMANRKIN